jgi:hypothetical protein
VPDRARLAGGRTFDANLLSNSQAWSSRRHDGRQPISNYAFKPIAEQALRSNQTIVPQRLNAALAFILPLRARNLRVVKECIELTRRPDCRLARDCGSVGGKALRRAAFVRLSLSASPVSSSVRGLSSAGRIARGWRAGTVLASAGGWHCGKCEARLPRLARRLSCRPQSRVIAAARLRAVGSAAHARLGHKDEKLTMQSSRRRIRLLAQAGHSGRRGLLRR